MQQVSVVHIGQQHKGQPFRGQHNTDEGQHVWVVQTAHEQPLTQEGLHLLQFRDACRERGSGPGQGAPLPGSAREVEEQSLPFRAAQHCPGGSTSAPLTTQ